MAGTINSLGIGSGVLTSDIIEKLKANDEKLTVTPIDNKITLTNQKNEALSLLESLMTSFKSSASALATSTVFDKRSVTGNTDGISVTADNGVAVTSFTISETSLAKQNVLEAKGFSALDETIALGSGTLNINVDGTDYKIAYTNATTLEDLKNAINDTAGDGVEASILQTGSDAYSLVLASKSTGVDQSITLSDLSGKLKTADLLGDSFTSGTFGATTNKVATGSGSMLFALGNETYSIDYTDATTLSQLAKTINDDSTLGTKVHAAVIKYGNDDYRLSITNKGAASDEPLVITDKGGFLNSALKSDALTSSGSFASSDALIAVDGTPESSGSFRVNIDGSNYDFAYNETTTLQGLADAINADTSLSTKVKASIVEYGSGDFRLVLSNTADSQDQTITTSDIQTAGAGLVANLAGGSYTNASSQMVDGGASVIQEAKDASFKYNGITLTRSSNEISDIISGVTISLLQEDERSNFSITQAAQSVSDELQNFTDSYNSLMEELHAMTTSDTEAGTVGIFNGDNAINSIRREINKMLTTFKEDGYSLMQFGISLNETGSMSYDSSDYFEKFEADPLAAQRFFSGETILDNDGNATFKNGIFDDINDLLHNYTKSDGYLTNMQSSFSTELKALNDDRERTTKLLEARYDAMTSQFIQYDAIISRLNNQFSVLNNMIQAELNN